MSKSLKQLAKEFGVGSNIYEFKLDFSKMELPPVPPMNIEAEMRVFNYYQSLEHKEDKEDTNE